MIPSNVAAEADVLGAMLYTEPARVQALTTLTPDCFYDPGHRAVFSALLNLVAAGKPVNATTVATELVANKANVGREFVVALMSDAPASWTAQIGLVADCGARRRLVAQAEQLERDARDPSVPLDDTMKALVAAPDMVRAPEVEPIRAPDIMDLAGDPPRPFVFEGLLRRRERVSIVARGGVGKSHLGFTVAVYAAAGVHPFTGQAGPKASSLVVDLENESYDIGETAREIGKSVSDRYSGGCHAMSRPQGMNLLRQQDVRWLESLVAHHEPALLVIGPLYKMFRGADGKSKASEEAAEEVASALDELRVKYDTALWIENHPPHSEDRTRGSSLWDGWFNFSFFAKRVSDRTVELRPTRGPRRRDRNWPWGIREGVTVPWEAVWEKPGMAAA